MIAFGIVSSSDEPPRLITKGVTTTMTADSPVSDRGRTPKIDSQSPPGTE